jgi:hypothetical protein
MNLKESIRKILREEIQFSNEFKRRVGEFDAWVWDCYVTRNPCEYESFEMFIRGVNSEIVELITDEDSMDADGPISNWLTYEEGVEYVKKYMLNDLKQFYNEECDEY